MKRAAFVLAHLLVAVAMLTACGDDGGDAQPGPTQTLDEFYADFGEMNSRVAAELRRIEQEEQGADRLLAAADAFEAHAAEMEALAPPQEAFLIDVFLIERSTELADALRRLAEGEQDAGEEVAVQLDGYELGCENLVSVANATIGDAGLDCYFAHWLVE